MPTSDHLPSGWSHTHFPETDSTMLLLRRPPFNAADGGFVLVTADYQTAGRGQRGTSWEADAGENLLFGIRCHPTFLRPDHQFLLSEVQALAIVEAVDSVVAGAVIKWPNDVYHGDRKICGMLLEHDIAGGRIATTITGVGLNVNQRQFRGDAPNPESLSRIAGRRIDRADLLRRIVAAFDRLYHLLEAGREEDVHRAYLARLYRRHGFHRYRDAGGEFTAEIAGVAPDGRLTLRDDAGRLRTYAFKEVAFVIWVAL